MQQDQKGYREMQAKAARRRLLMQTASLVLMENCKNLDGNEKCQDSQDEEG
jgi:hypothetical protein